MTQDNSSEIIGICPFMERFSNVMYEHFKHVLTSDLDIAVAVSGGADSLGLCIALSEYFQGENPDIKIHALSVDHALRPEARGELLHVAEILEDISNVTHHILTWEYDEQPTTRIQEQARKARYDLMIKYMRVHNIEHLFLGHHRDDQAETFLFRLAKGSGLDGLGGMAFNHEKGQGVTICRPLLDEGKADIIKFCEYKGIKYINDPSNENEDYARVRLRKSMEVLSAEGLTPKRLSVTAHRLSRAREALDSIAQREYNAALISKDSCRIVFNSNILLLNPFEVVLRVLLKAMYDLSPDREYSPRLERVENLCSDLLKPSHFRKRTLGGIIFERDMENDNVNLSRE